MKIKVMTYNIHKGFDLFGSKFILHKIKEEIKKEDIDVLFIQEVVGENKLHKTKIKNWPTETQFEFLADSIWSHYSYGKNAIFDHSHHGNAILSKFPIVFSENINISTNRFEQRGLLHIRIHIPNKNIELDLFNVHLNLLHGGRRLQASTIIKRMNEHIKPNSPLILAGDFNDWTIALSSKFSEEGLVEAHQLFNGKHARSYPCIMPTLPLDRIYFKDLHLENCSLLNSAPWTRLSDHLPLVATFKL